METWKPGRLFGGEGGIRTLDTFPYTRFPGELLQPLGHLTVFFEERNSTQATIKKQLIKARFESNRLPLKRELPDHQQA